MKISVVSNDPQVRAELSEMLRQCGHVCRSCRGLGRALEEGPELVFCEWQEGPPLAEILEALRIAEQLPKAVPVIALVRSGGTVTMRRAQDAGATDVLLWPPQLEEVQAEIDAVSDRAAGRDTLDREAFETMRQDTLVGKSPNFLKCLEELKKAARCEVNVLLVGETGTGKEMIARAIHNLSSRANRPFLAVNCASLSGTVLESELFGHAKGAFTGAHAARVGRFEAVGAGTLLLDEIGDLKISLQIKLLRVIEQCEFQRVGENKNLEFHGRLICATLVDLDRTVEAGRFRRDLLGRIDQFRIPLPPLRERPADIPILIRRFMSKHSQARPVEISRPAMELLESYDYPMNVRELENAIRSALARSDPGKLILPQHLPAQFRTGRPAPTRPECRLIQVPTALNYDAARCSAEREIDRIYLQALLTKHKGNQSRAAEEAGIDRGTFAKRLAEASEVQGEKQT